MRPVDLFWSKLGATPRRILLSGALTLQALFSLSLQNTPPLDAKEALRLRRITEYWKEENYQDAKGQILSYLSEYPSSAYQSELYAMLGDLYFLEEQPQEALACYEKINSSSCFEITIVSRLHCLLNLGRYQELLSWAENPALVIDSLQEEKKERLYLLLAESAYKLTFTEENEENRRAFASRSLEYYARVQNPLYRLSIGFASTELLTLLDDKEKAAELYLQLAKEVPERADELLFQAASLLVDQNPAQASSLFAEVALLESPLQQSACYNQLMLLFRQKAYSEFLEAAKQLSVATEKQHILQFCQGISLQELGQFQEAATHLKSFLASPQPSSTQFRQSCLSLFICAKETSDLSLVEEVLEKWHEQLPLDNSYLHGLLLKAHIAARENVPSSISSALEEILELYPQYEGRELVSFDYGQSLLMQKKWVEARQVFRSFAVEFPTSLRLKQAWQNIIYTSMQLVQETTMEEKSASKELLVSDLQTALDQNTSFKQENSVDLQKDPLFDDETVRIYRLGLAQLLFETGKRQEALEVAAQYAQDYPDHPTLYAIHLMRAACHLALGSPPESFIEAAELALALETDTASQNRLHLQLFNAYLVIGNRSLAFDHLLSVYRSSPELIRKENLFWLASRCANTEDVASTALKIEILESALGFDGHTYTDPTSLESHWLENESLKLASCYAEQGDYLKQIALFEALRQLQTVEAEMPWQKTRHILFELGQLYQKLGEPQKALTVYEELVNMTDRSVISFYQSAALLEKARLEYSLLEETQKRQPSEQLSSILSILKDLQITKNPLSEPIHLEAALDYAMIRTLLAEPCEQVQKQIFYLRLLKEDFFPSSITEAGAPYQEQCSKSQEGEAILRSYLRFIEAEIVRLESQIARDTGDLELATQLEQKAKYEFDQLMIVNGSKLASLQTRVRESLNLMESMTCPQ